MEAKALAQLLVGSRAIVWAVTGRPAAAAAAVATFQHCRQALPHGQARQPYQTLHVLIRSGNPAKNLCSALMLGDKWHRYSCRQIFLKDPDM